jgi:hypothetical protein
MAVLGGPGPNPGFGIKTAENVILRLPKGVHGGNAIYSIKVPFFWFFQKMTFFSSFHHFWAVSWQWPCRCTHSWMASSDQGVPELLGMVQSKIIFGKIRRSYGIPTKLLEPCGKVVIVLDRHTI